MLVMDLPRRWRLVGLLLVLLLLSGLFVTAGATEPDPEVGAYPGGSDLAEDYEPYVSTPATVSGEVIGDDPVVIEGEIDGEAVTFTLIDAPDFEEGQWVSAFGTVTADGEITVEDAVVREHWKVQYMYLVSGVGALLLLGLVLLTWRVDVGGLYVTPRGDRDG